MTWRTVLTLIVCRSVFRLLASLAGRGLPNFALVWLAGLLICQEVAQVAIHAVPVSVTGLAVWTLSRCAIKGLARQAFRQLVSEVALLALVMCCPVAGSLAHLASTLGTLLTLVGLAARFLRQEKARITSGTVTLLRSIILRFALRTTSSI